MATPLTEPTLQESAARVEIGSRVAGQLADAVSESPEAALATARSLSDEEVVVGLAFLIRVTQVTSASARALTDIQEERKARPTKAGWH